MAQMAKGDTLPNGWKKTTITCTDGVGNGADLSSFLASALPNCKYAFGLLDTDLDTAPATNNTVMCFVWCINASASTYQRNRGGNNVGMGSANWTANYDAFVAIGATFTVVYVE